MQDKERCFAGKAWVHTQGRESKSFEWTSLTVSRDGIEDALKAPFGNGWPTPFGLSVSEVARWLQDELLPSSPFGQHGMLVPWPEEDNDQLGHGGWVGYSRRQVCYLTAKSFFGARARGYDAGLFRLMSMCPRTGDFRQSFAMLLAACALDYLGLQACSSVTGPPWLGNWLCKIQVPQIQH